MKLMSAATMGIAGLVTVGLLSLSNMSASAEDGYAKRDEDAVDLVLMDDDDDDDTNDDTNSNTGNSASTNDNTASNFTGVSRDRDLSRSDKTRDWTRDGSGDRKRDWSGNKTNDRSRNDTR